MSAMKLVLLAALLAASASAISITWTGYGGDNQWTNKINWSPDQVPTTADDVTINQGVVLVTIATGCNSLVMGTSFNGPANLTVFQAFFIGTGGLNIEGNGNLFINSGTAAVTGQVTVAGNLYFQSGTLSGQWQITNRGVADLSGPAQKAFTGCQFSSAAMSFVFSGVMALNQSSQIVVTSALVMSGDVSIQAQDSTQVLVDTSAGTLTYTGNGDLQIQAPVNIGTFNFQGGNLTIYDDITFKNPFVIPSTSFVATVGSAVANLSAGVSGAGVLTAAGANILLGNTSITGAFNLVGGNATFGAAGSNIALFTISGGFAVLNYAVSTAQLNLLAGNIVGPAAVTATQLYSNSQGFNLDAPIIVAGNASLGGLVAFGSSGSINIAAAASANAIASLTFTGVPGQTVTNQGTLVVSNPVVFQNINLAGSGSVSVSSSLQIQSATVAQSSVALSGTGSFSGSSTQITGIAAVSAPSVVKAVIGSYKLTCPKECDNVSTVGTPASSFQFTA